MSSYCDCTNVAVISVFLMLALGGTSTAVAYSVGKANGRVDEHARLVEERSEAIAAPLIRELLSPDAFEKHKACSETNPCRAISDSNDRVGCHYGFMKTCLGVKPRAEAQ
jgi:hypothetical protein